MATRQVHQTIPCHVLQCVTKLIVGGATYQEVEVWSMTFLSPKRKVRILSFEKKKTQKPYPIGKNHSLELMFANLAIAKIAKNLNPLKLISNRC